MVRAFELTLSTTPEQLDGLSDDSFMACLTAALDNVGRVLVGDESSQPIELAAGDSCDVLRENLKHVWVKATNVGDKLQIIAYTGSV